MPIDDRRVKELVTAALELPDDRKREEFLDRECAGDTGLVRRIREVLAAHDPLPSPDKPQVSGVELTVAHGGETPGAIIDKKYKLLQHIGEGGMGSVWMADQFEPVKRRVALKLIHTDRGSSKTILARFEAERQAIALMDHPNIAKLLDAGTTDSGAPYFAMELVKGVRLTEYCDNHKLSVPERLVLFQQICSAVQHAHQKGIIHRDLKPSNVLVESHDGKPVPKVIDFGLAKAITGQQLTEHTLFTALGQVAGTPLYMSPEQAAYNALDVDTRADIYSLGVILYELITGSTPIERARLKQAAYDEVLRLVRENEPPLPSKRLSTTTAEPSVAVNRQLEPTKLGRFVKGELDWIVMKALAKERDRRYDSASSFAKDIERFLHNEPVQAGPPSAAYKLRKFIRRNRPQVVAATAVAIALVVSVIGTTWGLIEARRARQAEADRAAEAILAKEEAITEKNRAEAGEKLAGERLVQVEAANKRTQEEEEISRAVRSFLQSKLLRQADVWVQADALVRGGDLVTSADRNVTVRELLNRAAAELTRDKIDASFPNPKVQAELLRTVGATYLSLNELPQAVELLRRAADLCENCYPPDDEAGLSTLDTLAHAYELSGNLPEAVRLYERVRDTCEKKLPANHNLTRRALSNLGLAYVKIGKVRDAIPLLDRALAASKSVNDTRSASATLNCLGSAYTEIGDWRAAIKHLDEARKLDDEHLGAGHPLTLLTLRNLAIAYFEVGERTKAKSLMDRVREGHEKGKLFGPDHPETLRTLVRIAIMHADEGDRTAATELLNKVRDGCQQRGDSDVPEIMQIRTSAGATYAKIERFSDAIALLKQARSYNEVHYPAEHPQSLAANYALADAHFRAKQLRDSIELFEQVRTIREMHLEFDRRSLSKVLCGLGMAYLAADRLPESLATLEKARDCLGKPSETDEILRANASHNLAAAYFRTGNHDKAIELFKEVADVLTNKFGATDRRSLMAGLELGIALKAAKRTPEAIDAFERVRQSFDDNLGPDREETLKLLNELGDCYLRVKNREKSIAVEKELLTRMKRKFPGNDFRTVSVMATLGVVYCDDGRPKDGIPVIEEAFEVSNSDRRLAWVLVELQNAGIRMIDLQRYVDAEAILVGCTSFHAKLTGKKESPLLTSIRLYLGVALLGQKRATEAEPYLQAAAQILHTEGNRFPPEARKTILDAIRRLIDLYEAAGNKDSAAKWRKELDALSVSDK